MFGQMLEPFVRLALAVLLLSLAGCGQPTGNANSERNTAAGLQSPSPVDSELRPTSAAEALERLLQGNGRFASGHPNHPDADSRWRHRLVAAQQPFATVLGCSDSRVPPEITFDQGVGDIFVVRVAGEALDPSVEGSLEYGVYHLNTPLILVLGHEDCGAIKAALAALDNAGHNTPRNEAADSEPPEIQALVKLVEPSLANLNSQTTQANRIQAAVEANVQRVTDQLRHLPALQSALNSGKLKIVGGVYYLDTGIVRLLP